LLHWPPAVTTVAALDYFLSTVFNYPTLAECYKVAAHNAANKLALVRQATASAPNPVTTPACASSGAVTV